MKVWRPLTNIHDGVFQLLIWIVPSYRPQLSTIKKIYMQMHKWYLLKCFWSATSEFQFELTAKAYTIWSSFFISILHVIKKLANFNLSQPLFLLWQLSHYWDSAAAIQRVFIIFTLYGFLQHIISHFSMDCINAEAWDSFFVFLLG